MAFAQGNFVATRILEEVTAGVTPAAALTTLRGRGDTLQGKVTTVQSQEIRSDGNISDTPIVKGSSSGDISIELSYGEYDKLFASALRGTYSTAVSLTATDISFASADNSINSVAAAFSTANILPGYWIKISGSPLNSKLMKVVSVTTSKIVVSHVTIVTEIAGASITLKSKSLRNATTKKTFTVENEYPDIAKFQSFVGMIVTTMSLNAASGAIIEGSFGMLGREPAWSGTTVGTGAAIPVTANPIMTATANVGSVFVDGVATTARFKSLNLTTDTSARELDAVSSLYAIDINIGTLMPKLAMDAYLADSSLLEKYLAGTPFSIAYSFTDASGNTIVVDLPKMKFDDGTVNNKSLNADVMQALSATALVATDGYAIQLSML